MHSLCRSLQVSGSGALHEGSNLLPHWDLVLQPQLDGLPCIGWLPRVPTGLYSTNAESRNPDCIEERAMASPNGRIGFKARVNGQGQCKFRFVIFVWRSVSNSLCVSSVLAHGGQLALDFTSSNRTIPIFKGPVKRHILPITPTTARSS